MKTSFLHNFWNRAQSAPVNQKSDGSSRHAGRERPRTGVQALPTGKLTDPMGLPNWSRLRTARNGDIPLTEADRSFVAVLDCDALGNLLLYVAAKHVTSIVFGIEATLQREGVVYKRCETTPEILSILYDNKQTIETLTEGEGNRQAELFDELLAKAIDLDASDIHIEQGEQRTVVRMRVHGELQVVRTLSTARGESLARMIFASADVSGVDFQPNQYQDAKIVREVTTTGGKKIKLQLRFADMPVYPRGFDVTMRVARSGSGTLRSLEELGYNDAQLDAFEKMLSRPTGLIVMCGSTGSGKTTTLASLCEMLARRFNGTRKIRTIEDPPELEFAGARQTPVVRSDKEGTSADFSRALRAAMRGDPDVLLVGEVRDKETGRLSMEATMTGHKVLTTVHASSPFDAVDRLIDLDFRRQVLTADNTLSGVVYQALIPLICPHCASPLGAVRPTITESGLYERLQRFYGGSTMDLRFRGPGCDKCGLKGVVGRTVVASFLVPDRRIQSLILHDQRLEAEDYWRTNNWEGSYAANGKSVLAQAMDKMREGLVSPVDVELICGDIEAPNRDDSKHLRRAG